MELKLKKNKNLMIIKILKNAKLVTSAHLLFMKAKFNNKMITIIKNYSKIILWEMGKANYSLMKKNIEKSFYIQKIKFIQKI